MTFYKPILLQVLECFFLIVCENITYGLADLVRRNVLINNFYSKILRSNNINLYHRLADSSNLLYISHHYKNTTGEMQRIWTSVFDDTQVDGIFRHY